MHLVCPAGSPPALMTAVDHGADAVYVGFRDQTNARAFPGLNFTEADLHAGIRYAHARGRKVYVALHTDPGPGAFGRWQGGVVQAGRLGGDGVGRARGHPRDRQHRRVEDRDGAGVPAPPRRHRVGR